MKPNPLGEPLPIFFLSSLPDDALAWLPSGWTGTVLDLLSAEGVPEIERLWLACRVPLFSERSLRLFAAWCAESVGSLHSWSRTQECIDGAIAAAKGEMDARRLVASYLSNWSALQALQKEMAARAKAAAARGESWKVVEGLVWESYQPGARAAVNALTPDASAAARWAASAAREAAALAVARGPLRRGEVIDVRTQLEWLRREALDGNKKSSWLD